MKPVKVFIGMDKRQEVAYTVCRASIERNASSRVSVEPIKIEWTPIKRRGLTDFTFARYAVPWLCNYHGRAIFMDADIIVRGDVCELDGLLPEDSDLGVVKAKLKFEWPSVMVFNNTLCKTLTPEFINDATTSPQGLTWAKKITELPPEWNHCVGYDKPLSGAKLVHYTAGIPCFPETVGCEYAKEWQDELNACTSSVPWEDLMGRSVHAEMVKSGHLQKLGWLDMDKIKEVQSSR